MLAIARAGAGSGASEPAAQMLPEPVLVWPVPVLLTWEDVQNGPPQRKVGARTANRYLKQVRTDNTGPLGDDNIFGITERWHDIKLVAPDVFDWRGWLAHRVVDT